MGLPRIEWRGVRLEPAGTAATVEPLREVLVGDAVTEWWGPDPVAELLVDLRTVALIRCEGELVGALQCHADDEPAYPVVAFDIALGPTAQGRGIGPRALVGAMRHYAMAGHHRFTIDPACDNARAVRAYHSAGFEPVGVMRAYERHGPTGTWRDALLMQLLAWEHPDLRDVYTGPPAP